MDVAGMPCPHSGAMAEAWKRFHSYLLFVFGTGDGVSPRSQQRVH